MFDYDDIENKIIDVLKKYLKCELSKTDSASILFSGGIDSTILAKMSSEIVNVKLYTVALPGSHDELWSCYVAKKLGMNHHLIVPDKKEINDSISHILDKFSNMNMNLISISVETVMYIGMMHMEEEIVVSGQGADELFGGYNRYKNMAVKEFEKNSKKDYEMIFNTITRWDQLISKDLDKKIIYPYIYSELASLDIPYNFKFNNGINKYVLRSVATKLGIPEDISFKGKKAAQYSSGIYKMAKRAH